MGKNIRRTSAQPATQECLLSAAASILPLAAKAQAELVQHPGACPLNVLTLTPFYPSAEDKSQGSFIAEPLQATERLGVCNHVIAVQPFYRTPMHVIEERAFSAWKQYFSIPGNAGLALAGSFLARSLVRQVRRLHAQQPLNLVHAHGALPCGYAAALLSRRFGIPFVVSVHGLDAFAARQVSALWRRWCRRKSERVYRAAKAVICVSQKVADQVGQCSGAKRVIIHNGVDTNLFSPGAESSPLTVLSVGNLIPIKGHALLLRAFAHVSATSSECRLEIIGDGPERERLVNLANELGIADRVSFTGRLSREAVAEATRHCTMFALPSSYEGLGCVYLEAMASAKPTIGCVGQGIDEIIESGKNGMLVSPGSLEELSSVLQTLLSNTDLRMRMGSAARTTILQKHTLEHQATQLTELYRECVA